MKSNWTCRPWASILLLTTGFACAQLIGLLLNNYSKVPQSADHHEALTRGSSTTRTDPRVNTSHPSIKSSTRPLHLCPQHECRPWLPALGPQAYRHLRPVLEVKDEYDQQLIKVPKRRGSCHEYLAHSGRSRYVVSHLCTNCDFLAVRDSVTLLLPMTDKDTFWQRLKSHDERWGGPISVGLLIKEQGYPRPQDLLRLLEERLMGFQHHSPSICIHILQEDPATQVSSVEYFPVNTLRNVATKFAQTESVLLLEADFVTPRNMSTRVREVFQAPDHQDTTNTVHVIPVFEILQNLSAPPDTREELLKGWADKTLQSIVEARPYYETGHLPTDYNKLKTTTKPYTVAYQPFYEPYYVVNRSEVPLYPEEFQYGSVDKAIHATLMNKLGYVFEVIPNLFVLHPSHPRAKRPKDIGQCGHKMYSDLLKFIDAKNVLHQDNTGKM